MESIIYIKSDFIFFIFSLLSLEMESRPKRPFSTSRLKSGEMNKPRPLYIMYTLLHVKSGLGLVVIFPLFSLEVENDLFDLDSISRLKREKMKKIKSLLKYNTYPSI